MHETLGEGDKCDHGGQEAECGIRPSVDNNNFSKRIIGGNRAKFAELPWQVRKNRLLWISVQ